MVLLESSSVNGKLTAVVTGGLASPRPPCSSRVPRPEKTAVDMDKESNVEFNNTWPPPMTGSSGAHQVFGET